MQDVKEKLPLDAKLLSEAIIELNISARNVSIYPEDHPSIEKTINKVHELLMKLFEIRSNITLAIAKDTLIVDHHYLDKKNPVYKEFALALFDFGIAHVTFYAGLTKEEIVSFHKIITSKKEEIEADGGILKALEDKKVSSIKVSLIDYAAFHAVEGSGGNGEGGARQKENIWETFVYGLLEDRLSEKDEEINNLDALPPETLAMLVNRSLPDNSKQETYDKVITSYLRNSSDAKRSRGESFTRFLKFIDGLKPSLKKQFLSGTFNFLTVDSAYAEDILNQLSTDNLLTILQQINEQDAYIPPQLKSLLGKFSKLRGIDQQSAVGFDMDIFTGEGIVDDIQVDLESFKLLSEHKVGSYVTLDYQKEIDAIVSADFNVIEQLKLHEFEVSFEERSLDAYVLDTYIDLLNNEALRQSDFAGISEKLKEMAGLYLEKGEYREISTVYNAMIRHASGPYSEDALKILSWMNSENFIHKLLSSFRAMGRKYRDEAAELCLSFGEGIISPVIDSLIEEKSTTMRKFLMTILVKIGKPVIREAQKRLYDKRWYATRNMLILLRECDAVEEIETIREFCTHENVKIAFEALRTLLHFDDRDVHRYIAQHLRSDDPYVRERAIVLAGAYKITESVPVLLELLQRKDNAEKGFSYKIPIVQALASIGDPSAIPHLIDAYNAKSFLFRSSLEELKMEIIKSLRGYTLNAVRPLIELGLSSKDREIRNLCEKMFY